MDNDQIQKSLAAFNQFISDPSSKLDIVKATHLNNIALKFDGQRVFNSQRDMRERVNSCREMYENVGIVGNIVDLMTDFAIEEFTIVHESKPIQNFFRNWAKKVDLFCIGEEILKSFYRDGNVPIFRFDGLFPRNELNEFRRTVAKESSISQLINDNVPQKNIIPIRYLILDVTRMTKVHSGLFGENQFLYHITQEDIDIIKRQILSGDNDIEEIASRMGIDVFERLMTQGSLELDSDKLTILYYKKDSHKMWASPMLWRIVRDVRYKELLRKMDISAAEGVIGAIIIFKLGKLDNDPPIFPDPEKMTKLVNLLRNNNGSSKYFVWDNLIDIVDTFPPVDKILGKEKYEQVDKDIRSGLGIPESLIGGGTGGSFGNQFLAVKTLMERLETGRKTLLEWVNSELRSVSKAMGFRKPPSVTMRNMSLNNDEVEKRLALELADRNIISYQTVREIFGQNSDIEIQRMREEDKDRKKDFENGIMANQKLGKFGPTFNKGWNIGDFFEGATEVDAGEITETPSEQESEGDNGGSPTGRRGRQTTKTTRDPQGEEVVALDLYIYDRALESLSLIYESLAYSLCKNRNYKNEEEIPSVALDQLYGFCIKALCNINLEQVSTVDLIRDALKSESGKKLESCVKQVTRQRVDKFKEKNKREPNKEERQDIISSSFAICKSRGLK